MDRRHLSSGFSGNTLGKYRLLAELGRGGMAEVFLAVAHGPAGFNKLVVLKQIAPTLAEDPEFLAMFLDEARLAARLSHPNVVQTNEVGQDGDRYFIAMEYLEGQPLNRAIHRLGRDKGMPLAMHLRVLVDALAGLHHAHELTDYDGTPLEVVHRDATPHNLFVTYDGQAKVVDFGIAKAMNSSSETRTGVLKGKVAYMSPEQARGEPVDRRADIFSVGVMIWEALVQRRLWKGIADVAILHHIVSGDIPKPRSLRAGIPPELEAVCLRALAVDRDDRYRTAAELASHLEHAIEALGDRSTVRDAGRLLADAFAQERGRIRQIIEAQLGAATAMPTAEYRAVPLPLLLESGPTTQGSSADDVSGPGNSPSLTPSYTGSAQIVPTPSHAGRHSFTPPPGSSPSAQFSTPFSITASSPVATHAGPGSPKRGLLVGAAVASAALVAGLLWVATQGLGPGAAATQPEAAPPAPPVPTTPDEVMVTIVATPSEAQLFLDDKPLGNNPYSATLPVDGSNHILRAEAKGFKARTKELRLDHDVELEIALEVEEKQDKPTKTTPRAAAQTTPAPAPDGDADGLKRIPKPKRAIDATNPYQ